MPYYRVNFSENTVIDSYEITKKDSLHDYLLARQYKRFVHFDKDIQPSAYLCKASSIVEAREFAFAYLEKLSLVPTRI